MRLVSIATVLTVHLRLLVLYNKVSFVTDIVIPIGKFLTVEKEMHSKVKACTECTRTCWLLHKGSNSVLASGAASFFQSNDR